MVLVWITQDVSPFCQYSLLVVIVLVALQLTIATALTAVKAAITKIFFIVFFPFFFVLSLFNSLTLSLFSVHSAALYAASFFFSPAFNAGSFFFYRAI